LQRIDERLLHKLEAAEANLEKVWKRIDQTALINQDKVLSAFQSENIGLHHFHTTTGYGYNDLGREALEALFAKVFCGEAALVRQQFASGTHAITTCLRGILRPGDEIIFANDKPYDTLQSVFGINQSPPPGHLGEYGITPRIAQLNQDGELDFDRILSLVNEHTRIIAFQRSSGYSGHQSLSIRTMEEAFRRLRSQIPSQVVFFVDNCYGEFVEEREPLEVGADIIAGSLIKNPGGGLAPSGGYVVGKKELVDRVAAALFAPGIGGEVGATLANPRPFFQGFFEAPTRVGEMLKSATLWAEIFKSQGLSVSPTAEEPRTDIIQRVELETADRLELFCRVLQKMSPVDSRLTPLADAMPGYDHPVIMAAGTFVAGSTSELSVDAPFIPPYYAFLQGGLILTHTKLTILHWLKLWENQEEIS
jgi:cystathionine beta-lyase family protein involved in aluminum resistance